MLIDIAKGDLLMLRRQVYDQYLQLKATPAAQSDNPDFRRVVEPQMKFLAKLVRKLNRACTKAYGHDCSAYCFPVK